LYPKQVRYQAAPLTDCVAAFEAFCLCAVTGCEYY
jgi:hypothetical protein